MLARQNRRNCRANPIGPTRKSQTETYCITYRCAWSPIRHLSSRDDFNPHSRTFSIAARVRRTTGFLQVSLSKIRGYIDVRPACTCLAADFRSTLATSQQLAMECGSAVNGSTRNVVFGSLGFFKKLRNQVASAVGTVEKPERFFAEAFPSRLWKSSRRSRRRHPSSISTATAVSTARSAGRFGEPGPAELLENSRPWHRPDWRSSFINDFRGTNFLRGPVLTLPTRS